MRDYRLPSMFGFNFKGTQFLCPLGYVKEMPRYVVYAHITDYEKTSNVGFFEVHKDGNLYFLSAIKYYSTVGTTCPDLFEATKYASKNFNDLLANTFHWQEMNI